MDVNILYKPGGVDSHEAIADGGENSCSRYELCRAVLQGVSPRFSQSFLICC